MRLFLILLLFTNPVKDLNKVAETNSLKKEAKEAYNQGKFDEAIKSYERLTHEYGVSDDKVLLNMAHAYFKNDAKEEATNLYNSLSQSNNKSIGSAAYNQLGVLANQLQKKEEAINYFKEAIRADPSNEAARFNYSKLKKEQEEQQQQDQDNKDQNQDQDNKDQQSKDQDNKDQNQQDKENQEQQDQSEQEQEGGEEKEEQQNEEEQQNQDQQDADQKSRAEKLEEMNMSEEKAEMILEAMKNNEIQYIQQNRKKPQSRVDDGRPDW